MHHPSPRPLGSATRSCVLAASLLAAAPFVSCDAPGTDTPRSTAGALRPATEPAEPGVQSAHHFERRVARELATGYLLFLPASYDDDPARTWPLLVHLHGGGGRGADLEKLRHYPLVQRLEREPDFPFVTVTPQCPAGDHEEPLGDLWTEHAGLVLELIDELIASYRIDPDRVVLVGHSMGGYGAWYLAHRAPERFAAVVAMSGPGVTWWTYRIARAEIPVWVFHGERDEAVPIAESERMVEALRAAGGNVRFTRYPEGGHPIREPFDGEEPYRWLLEQRRSRSRAHAP